MLQTIPVLFRNNIPGPWAARTALALFAALLALLLASSAARAQVLVLENLVVDNKAGEIMVRFGLEIEEPEEVIQALQDGAVLQLECEAELDRHRSYWLNADISDVTYTNTLRLDPITREFSLAIPGKEQPVRNTDFTELTRAAWSEISLDLGPWNILEKGKSYSLNLKIRVKRSDVPMWLRSALFFWSWDVVSATSYQLDFIY